MIKRTNLALGVSVALFFIPHVNHKFVFFVTVLVSTLIPEFNFSLSKSGFKGTRHISFLRKLLRTYITPTIISIILAFAYPILALPFFLGYSFTLSLDAFSKEGIQPFWPLSKKHTSGHITSGRKSDTVLFYALVIFDIALLIMMFL